MIIREPYEPTEVWNEPGGVCGLANEITMTVGIRSGAIRKARCDDLSFEEEI